MTYHLRRYRNSRYWYARITRPDGVRGNWLSTREEDRFEAERVARGWDEAVIYGRETTTVAGLRARLRDEWQLSVALDSGLQRAVAARLAEGPLVSGRPSRMELAAVVSECTRPGENGCLLWGGGASRKGYGRFKVGGRLYSPHRVVLENKLGRRLRRDEDTCHACDVPRCVNPEHLFAGSRLDNVRDAIAKGRHFIPGRSQAVVTQSAENRTEKGGDVNDD